MSIEYNSKLIASLYDEVDPEKAAEISDEMVEIHDPIFIQPIYSAFKKFKNTHFSHYFLSDLVEFKTPETTEIFKAVVSSEDKRGADFSYCIEYFSDIDYIEDSLINKVYLQVLDELLKNNTNEYDLEDYLEYLLKAKSLSLVSVHLRNAFENEDQKSDVKSISLNFFLKENPSTNLRYYLENFDRIKGKKSEIILAKTLIKWKGKIVESLKQKILDEGTSHAQEIIKSEIKKKTSEQQEIEKNIAITYNNSEIISEISQLRSRINVFSQGDNRFGFPIFLQSELLFPQTKAPEDKTTFKSYCNDLRSFIQSLTKDLVNHGFSEEEIKEKFPQIQERKSINLLYLYLKSKGFSINDDIFNLRKLNQIVSKMAHPDDEKGLLDILRENGLLELYSSDNFQDLHRELLKKYKVFLEGLLNCFQKE